MEVPSKHYCIVFSFVLNFVYEDQQRLTTTPENIFKGTSTMVGNCN